MSQNSHVLLARQPIYNRKLEISAYELLFRSHSLSEEAHFTNGDKATSQVILNAFGEAGLESICGKHPAFINFTKKLIMDLPTFDPKHYVIEILENIEVDAELIEALTKAKAQGSRLALDDFILDHNSAPLLHLVDIVKVDVLALTKLQIERFAKVFIPRKLILLAEKVETHEMYEFCKNLGFEFFQGYFLSRPQNIEGQAIPDNKMVVLSLLSKVQQPDISAAELTETLSRDPKLGYKLLKLVNSAAFARIQKCTSLQQAIAQLGFQHIRSWVTLLALGNLDDKPLALRQTSLERAIICQKLGEKIGEYSIYDYYTVGLFSLLDAFIDRPILEIIKSLNLPDPMVKALMNNKGTLGLALHTAKCFQEARLDELQIEKLNSYGLDLETMNELYKQSLIESDEQAQVL
ncbi:MAG: EAL and modified HD-GYP domain-containing signal transduction protein [Oceanicoccus sp.]|jgi:EAL and modified HD-GYP domain-containing signal transduction protein